jgi:hypothetical protein
VRFDPIRIRFDSILIGCRFSTNSTQFQISLDSILIQFKSIGFDSIQFAPPVTFLSLLLLLLLELLLLFFTWCHLFVSLYHRLYHPVSIVN